MTTIPRATVRATDTGFQVEVYEKTYRSQLDVPDVPELDLDRVVAFGHTWSPTPELNPEPSMFGGHAIAVDMGFSTTVVEPRGHMSISERERIS